MKLRELIQGVSVKQTLGNMDTEVTELAYDSRKAQDGCLFFCIEGFKVDGHSFAGQAVGAGARALMVSRELDIGVPQIVVEDGRLGMAAISANFFGSPSDKLKMIGVTGTKGKTSTTYMIKSIAEAYSKKVGLIGTIVDMIGERELNTEKTTPQSLDLQRLLRQMLDEGVEW
ncbi:MAG: Mur ligase family protein, partial [Bacillota bacterium]|nr:Mur ligase family protein [Bacillota bacterium]